MTDAPLKQTGYIKVKTSNMIPVLCVVLTSTFLAFGWLIMEIGSHNTKIEVLVSKVTGIEKSIDVITEFMRDSHLSKLQ